MSDKIYLPTKDQQDQLLSLIGKTNDTGGSASAGTISAKLNSLISTLGTVNTNVSTIKTQVGSSSDTASQTGSSIQAKLKYVATAAEAINTNVKYIKDKSLLKSLSIYVALPEKLPSSTYIDAFTEEGYSYNKNRQIIFKPIYLTNGSSVDPFNVYQYRNINVERLTFEYNLNVSFKDNSNVWHDVSNLAYCGYLKNTSNFTVYVGFLMNNITHTDVSKFTLNGHINIKIYS